MIIDFTISNYRSIREPQTISFEATNDRHLESYYVVNKGKYRILKMATILGANASGKSNLIRAFNLLPKLMLSPCQDKSSEIRYEKFALSAEAKEDNSEIIVNFICADKKYHYEVVFNNNLVHSEKLQCHPFDKLRSHLVYERYTDVSTLVSTIKWGANYSVGTIVRDLNVNLLHNRTVFGAFQVSNVDIPVLKEIVDWLSGYMLPIVSTSDQQLFNFTSSMLVENIKDKQMVVSFLKKADVGIRDFYIEETIEEIPDSLLDIILNDSSIPEKAKEKIKSNPVSHTIKVNMLHSTSHGDVSMEYSEESNGTKRYYELSGVLMKIIKGSHFVAIDELECKLHPDLYKHFIISFLDNAKESQMVFTTHLREFLSDDDFFRRDSIWITEKNVDGETELYSLADFTEKEVSQLNVLEAYKAGRFGGIPHLGDTYID